MVRSRIKILICVALVGSGAILGCSGKRQETNSAGEQAAKAIQAGDYTAAIIELSNALARNPNDKRIRIQLASAYAGRAGLPLQSFIGLGRELANATRDVDRMFEQRLASIMTVIRNNMKNKAEAQTILVIEQVYMGSLRLSTILRQFEAVPIVRTPMQFEDLNQAVFILAGDQTIVGGGALYRALLRVAALRYRLENDIDRIRIRNCKADLNAIHQFVEVIYQESRAVLVDLGMATLDPAKRHQWDISVRKLDEGSQNLVTRLQDLSSSGLIDASDVVKLFNRSCR